MLGLSKATTTGEVVTLLVTTVAEEKKGELGLDPERSNVSGKEGQEMRDQMVPHLV